MSIDSLVRRRRGGARASLVERYQNPADYPESMQACTAPKARCSFEMGINGSRVFGLDGHPAGHPELAENPHNRCPMFNLKRRVARMRSAGVSSA